MYKLLIIDDEPLVRYGLKNTIDWAKYNVEIISEAKNGIEGLEKIDNLNPDIVLCDVKMPHMNGLDMIKKARDYGFDGEFILLSGFGEFEFAQKAIDYDVISYLLKPVSNEELVDTVLKAIEKLKQKRNVKNMNSFLDSGSEDLKRRIIRTLVRKDYNDIEVVKKEIILLNIAGYCFVDEGYFLIGVLDESYKENADELFIFENILASYLKKENIPFLSGIYHEKISFVIDKIVEDKLDDILSICFDKFKKESDLTISIGISSLFNDYHKIDLAYEEAKSVANNGLMRFINSVQYFNKVSKNYSTNLLRALDIIHKEYASNLDISYVSEKLNVSESYLMHLFKKELGITFNNVLTDTRLREAKILLKEGILRINEIAYKVGYNDEKYFTLVFKKKNGITPSEYAKAK